nr:hypothetical protein [Tanacetum cinerariifolium]
MINQDVKDFEAYKTYNDFATRKIPPRKARKYKKVALPIRKLSPVKEAEHVNKGKRVKRPANKSTTVPTASVVNRDTPGVSVSKKRAPAKADRSKGIEILSDGDSEDDNDDDSIDDSKGDNDKANSDDDGNSNADDNKRTDSDDDDENPSFTLKDYDKEEHDEEYKYDDDNENVFEDEDDDLYKDVNVRSLGAKQGQERKGDEEMTDVDQIVSQEKSYVQVIKDTHVTLTSSQKTDSSKQNSSISSDFLFHLTLLANFSSWKMFHQLLMKVSTLETELSQLKQADHFAQLLKFVKSQLLTMVDDLLSTIIRCATRTALESYTKDFEKKAQEERKLYIDAVEKLVKDIIKDEVKSLLPLILPKEVSNFATPVIQSTINESLKNVVLAKSSPQPKFTYEEAESLTEFELKKILLDKIERSESYKTAPKHKEFYEGLVKSYNLDKDLFSSYGKVYSLKRNRDDKDKDEDPSTGSDRGLKKRKTKKDAEPPKGSKLKESKTSSSKGTKSQPKSPGKSV